MKKGKEHHLCPACGRRTYRRIRRFPVQGKIDARCGTCYDRNFKPETVVPYDPAQEGAHPQAVGTRGEAADKVIFDEPFEQADQPSFFQDGGS